MDNEFILEQEKYLKVLKMKGFGEQYQSKKKSNKKIKPSKEQIINQALKFHSQGNISEAIKYYQYFINQGFKDHQVFSNYGVILKGFGKLQEAEVSTRKAIELKPDYADAYSNLGGILKDLGKLQDAEVSTRKAIELKPDYAMAHSNLGTILKDLGNLQEAEFSTRKAIELKPDYAEAYANLGTILKDLGNLQEAEFSTRKAIELKPDWAGAHYNLGNILKDLGKLQDAELSYRKTIKIKPDYAEAYANLGNILIEFGKSQEAFKYWIKSAELKPENEKCVKTLAVNLCLEKKYDLALNYLSKNKSNSCQSLYLGCLLSLDREKEFTEKYQELLQKKVCDANIGGVVEHANIIYEKTYDALFCNEAIKYVLIDKIITPKLS